MGIWLQVWTFFRLLARDHISVNIQALTPSMFFFLLLKTHSLVHTSLQSSRGTLKEVVNLVLPSSKKIKGFVLLPLNALFVSVFAFSQGINSGKAEKHTFFATMEPDIVKLDWIFFADTKSIDVLNNSRYVLISRQLPNVVHNVDQLRFLQRKKFISYITRITTITSFSPASFASCKITRQSGTMLEDWGFVSKSREREIAEENSQHTYYRE